MRTGLIVDSGCDLPYDFIDRNDIWILPISIRVGQDLWVDNRDPERTREFYAQGLLDKQHDAASEPFTAEEIRDLFLEHVVPRYDFAICQTITRNRSPIYENAVQASHAILRDYRERRRAEGLDEAFSMRVLNSRCLFAGQGALAAATIGLIKQGLAATEARRRVSALADNVYAVGVPQDLFYLRERARKKGDNSVSWMNAAIGKALDVKPIIAAYADRTEPVDRVRGFEKGAQRIFDFAAGRIEAGLLAPYVCVSYAGDPAEVEQLPGYSNLQQTAQQAGVELMVAPMAMTGGVNLGPGTLHLGLIAEDCGFN